MWRPMASTISYHLFSIFILNFIIFATCVQVKSKPDFISPETPPEFRVPGPCAGKCKFSLCDGRNDFILGHPDSALTNAICLDQTGSITIASTGEAIILINDRRMPVSKIPAHGIAPLPPTFFKTVFKGDGDGSALTHQTLQPGQGVLVNNQCMQLPIERYVYDPFFDEGIENRMGKNQLIDCIGVNIVVPRVMVKLEWNGNDDLDLEVIPPKGQAINFRNSKTKYGMLLNDDQRKLCDHTKITDGEEMILFKGDDTPIGNYTARVRLYEKCHRNVKFRLEIFIDGVRRQLSSGFATKGGNSIVADYKFQLER